MQFCMLVWCGFFMYPELLSPFVSLCRPPNARLLSSTSVCPRRLSCCVQSVVSVSYSDTHLQCCSISCAVIMSSTCVPACLACLLLLLSRQCMSSTSCKNIQLQNCTSVSPLGCPFPKANIVHPFPNNYALVKVAGTRISSHIISVVFPFINTV
jgi:hypothetical protein